MKNTTDLKSKLQIDFDWSNQSKKLMEKYPQLTSKDVSFETGKEEDLINRLETKLNKKRDEVINIIKKGQKVAF